MHAFKTHRKSIIPLLLLALFALSAQAVFGQSNAIPNNPEPQPTPPTAGTVPTSPVRASASEEFPEKGKVGIGFKVSLLGAGVEMATPIAHRANVRAGFNMIDYSRSFDKDSINYSGTLSFKTVEAHLDYFPWAKSFHISPGVLAYVGDPITANAVVAPGQSFSLGGTDYYSDATSPVTGNGKINFNRAAPMITVGWGNLVPRGETKHFSVPFEVGVAFQGSPKATLNLQGSVCDAPGVNCRTIASDATVQSQILSEQTKINNSMSFFKVYPIISVGFGYRF